jgi:SAM-dependent methyltransferase
MTDDNLVSSFRSSLQASLFRTLGSGIDQLEQEFGAPYRQAFGHHLALLRAAHPDRPFPAWPVNGFIALNRMILKEELAFRESRTYSAGPADMERITAEVYDSDAVMNGYYLVGLYLTYFIWPHHWQMLRYYHQSFLADGTGVERGDSALAGGFAEWGVGHGLLSLAALVRWPQARGFLFDLSDHSLAFARAVLEAAGHGGRCTFVQGDVLQATDLPKVARLVCSEVLEHVPDPLKVLQRVRTALLPGGRAFLTAAVNAPQSDHVYLYRSDEEVFEMAHQAGLRTCSSLSVVHPNRHNDLLPPSVVGLIVEPVEAFPGKDGAA